jgi:hypothetical protein
MKIRIQFDPEARKVTVAGETNSTSFYRVMENSNLESIVKALLEPNGIVFFGVDVDECTANVRFNAEINQDAEGGNA